MQSRYETINTYITKGIIEAHMEFAKTNDVPLCIAKFGFDVDLEDAFFFKNIIL